MKRSDIIREKLEKALIPEHMELINESVRHHGHGGDDGSGESHFKLIVVSSRFSGLSRVARHRLVHEILGPEINAAVHALSISALTPDEHK